MSILAARASCLLQLVSGAQAQAREESWKKTPRRISRPQRRGRTRSREIARCKKFWQRNLAVTNELVIECDARLLVRGHFWSAVRP